MASRIERGASIGDHPTPDRDPLGGFMLACAALWCAAIVAAPLFGLDRIYDFFSLICHQRPDRSWAIAGAPLPVCIRCLSIYGGFLIAMAIRPQPNSQLLRSALAATLLEFLIARIGFDFEVLRSLTGLALGFTAAGFVAAGIRELVAQRMGTRFAGANQ